MITNLEARHDLIQKTLGESECPSYILHIVLFSSRMGPVGPSPPVSFPTSSKLRESEGQGVQSGYIRVTAVKQNEFNISDNHKLCASQREGHSNTDHMWVQLFCLTCLFGVCSSWSHVLEFPQPQKHLLHCIGV